MLASQLLLHEMLVYPRTTAFATSAFRWLTHKGLVVGSSGKQEFDVTRPRDYALRPCRVQCRLGRQEIRRIGENLDRRRRATEFYLRELPALGYRVPAMQPDWDAPLVRFPVRVANKAEAIARSRRFGVEIGSWFECPLHPMETDMERFGYRSGMCPQAERASREVINLPTHRRVGEGDLRRTLEFVRKVCRPAEV